MDEVNRENGGLSCPHCGAAIDPDAEGRTAIVRCGRCGELVSLEREVPAPEERDDLDGMRIRHVYQMRRSVYRTRRYWLVGAGLCVVGAGQTVWKYFSPEGWVAMSGVQVVVLAIALVIGGIFCIRRALNLGRAAGRSVVGEPEGTPDFSRLSDGSQRWRNLEAMGGEEEQE